MALIFQLFQIFRLQLSNGASLVVMFSTHFCFDLDQLTSTNLYKSQDGSDFTMYTPRLFAYHILSSLWL
jgi:hypothetical protein